MCVNFAPACITHRALQRLKNHTLGFLGYCRPAAPRCSPLLSEGGCKKCAQRRAAENSGEQRGERRQYSLSNKRVHFVMCEVWEELCAQETLPLFFFASSLTFI